MLNTLIIAASLMTNFHKVRAVDVYDGDTFRVEIPGVPAVFGKHISIRVRGIDTPEMKGGTRCSREAAESAKAVLESYILGEELELKRCGRDKYFRLVCDVSIAGSPTDDVAAFMLARTLAVPYDGGTKKTWRCQR